MPFSIQFWNWTYLFHLSLNLMNLSEIFSKVSPDLLCPSCTKTTVVVLYLLHSYLLRSSAWGYILRKWKGRIAGLDVSFFVISGFSLAFNIIVDCRKESFPIQGLAEVVVTQPCPHFFQLFLSKREGVDRAFSPFRWPPGSIMSLSMFSDPEWMIQAKQKCRPLYVGTSRYATCRFYLLFIYSFYYDYIRYR